MSLNCFKKKNVLCVVAHSIWLLVGGPQELLSWPKWFKKYIFGKNDGFVATIKQKRPNRFGFVFLQIKRALLKMGIDTCPLKCKPCYLSIVITSESCNRNCLGLNDHLKSKITFSFVYQDTVDKMTRPPESRRSEGLAENRFRF